MTATTFLLLPFQDILIANQHQGDLFLTIKFVGIVFFICKYYTVSSFQHNLIFTLHNLQNLQYMDSKDLLDDRLEPIYGVNILLQDIHIKHPLMVGAETLKTVSSNPRWGLIFGANCSK